MPKIDILKLRDHAANISFIDYQKKKTTLSDYSGKILLLSFHPLAWTKVCTDQMLSLEESYERFGKNDVIPLGISVDPIPCKHAWARHLKLKNLNIISDFWQHGRIAKKFGIFRKEDGFSERANIIIDRQKKIVFFKVYPIKELPDIEEIFSFLKKMK